ncbi:ESPR domain-containing protein [Burkholderia stabilis]|uniref:ESPR domain-containing protein n=1 Tax=Burkholderia stabilis TaxID=95485 RepID=UPI00196A8C9A|nr:ESPR domain-containing protein [Burkholderia stabilis]
MNRAYRSIWNESLGTWVAVSELASARGKPKKSKVVQAAAVAVLALGAQVHDAHAQYVANASSSATQGASIAIGSAGGGLPPRVSNGQSRLAVTLLPATHMQ